MNQTSQCSADCSQGLKRIVAVIGAASGKKQIAAIVIPRTTAITLADEIWPEKPDSSSPMLEWGEEDQTPPDDWKDEYRERYCTSAKKGGHVGRIFDVPLFVASDMVVCVLDSQELKEVALREGWDLSEID